MGWFDRRRKSTRLPGGLLSSRSNPRRARYAWSPDPRTKVYCGALSEQPSFQKSDGFRWFFPGFPRLPLISFKTCQICQIFLALPRAAFVAGLVFRAFQNMRAAASNGCCDDVAITRADRRFDVAAIVLGGFEIPGPGAGVGEEVAKFAAMPASAGELAVPRPIGRRCERFGDAGPQMRHASAAQLCHCWRTRDR